MNVFYTKRAERDLSRIWDQIAFDSEAAATRVVLEIRDRCQLLSDQPFMGASCEDLRPGLRRFSVGWYVVYYRVVGDRASIARVLHGARDIESLF